MLQFLRQVSVSSKQPFPGYELFGEFCNLPPLLGALFGMCLLFTQSPLRLFLTWNLERALGAQAEPKPSPGAPSPLLSHCWRLRVTGARSPALPRGGGGGWAAGQGRCGPFSPQLAREVWPHLEIQKSLSGGTKPRVGPCGQHRGLGDAAPREGEQDPGPTGTRPTGFSSASWAARQSPSPASLPAAPHPLRTRLSVSGQTASRKTLSASHVQEQTSQRGEGEKQTPPSRPGGGRAPKPSRDRAAAGDHGPGGVGEATPPTPPGTDGAARGRPCPRPFHR